MPPPDKQPPPVKTWTVRSADGTVFTTSDPAVLSNALRKGGKVEAADEGAARARQAGVDKRYDTLAQEAQTVAERAVGAATFGLSDAAAAIAGNEYDRADATNRRRVNPNAAIAGEVIGTLPSLAGAGAGAASKAARLTPAGALSGAATKIVESGAEKGILAKAATSAAGGALEGAAQSGGAYVTDVALGDRDLTAEGALAAVGQGALLGGGVGAGAAVTERGLISAKRLFPKAEGGAAKAAAEQSSREVAQKLDEALRDSKRAEDVLDVRADTARAAREAADPEAAARARAAREAAAAGDALDNPILDAVDHRGRNINFRAGLKPNSPADPRFPAWTPAQRAAAEDRAARVAQSIEGDGIGTASAAAGRRPPQPGDDVATAAGRRAPSPDELAPSAAGELPTSAGRRAPLDPEVLASPPASGVGDELLAPPAAAPRGKRKVPGELVDQRPADKFHYKARRGREIPADDLEQMSNEDLLAGLRGDLRAGPPPKGTAKGAAKAAAGAPADDLEAQLAATLDEVAGGKSLTEVAAAKAPVAPTPRTAALAGGGDDLEAQLAASLEGLRAGQGMETLAARARRAQLELDDAVGDAAAIEMRSAAQELREARAELERVLTAPPPATRNLLGLSPGTAGAVTGTLDDAAGDAVEAMRRALQEAASGDVVEDTTRAITAIQRFEAAQLRAADALGDAAPQGLRRAVEENADVAARHAEAVQRADVASAQITLQERSGDLAEAMAAAGRSEAQEAANAAYPRVSGLGVLDPGAAALPGAAAGKSSRLLDAAAALDLLSETGIPGLPRASDIPVVGPLLSLYLKARAAGRVFGRFGGRLPASVEARAARQSAKTLDRARAAVNALLDVGAKAARSSVIPATAIASTIARPLLGGRTRDDGDPLSAWRSLRDELDQLSRPGVLEARVRAAAPTSDPELGRALVDVAARKRDFLLDKMPRPPLSLQSPFSDLVDKWHPSRLELTRFARYKEAVDDPVGVLERALAGQLSIEGVEALRTVFPRLYQEQRTLLLTMSLQEDRQLSRPRRQVLSVLFDVPLDPTQRPEYVGAMQANFAPSPPEPQPPPLAPGAPPVLKGSTQFSARAALPGEV